MKRKEQSSKEPEEKIAFRVMVALLAIDQKGRYLVTTGKNGKYLPFKMMTMRLGDRDFGTMKELISGSTKIKQLISNWLNGEDMPLGDQEYEILYFPNEFGVTHEAQTDEVNNQANLAGSKYEVVDDLSEKHIFWI